MAITLLIGADPASPAFTFRREDIRSRSLEIVTAVDLIGSELSADELNVEVYYGVGEYIWFSPADHDGVMGSDGYIFATSEQTADITAVDYATPVWLMDGSAVIHKLYFDSAVQVAERAYTLKAVSGVGLLERRRHMGGLYTGQTVETVLGEIIGNTFSYTVATDVKDQTVHGVLLADTARANLHKLMFAMGFAMRKDASGDPTFMYLSSDLAHTVEADRVFTGGNIQYDNPATAVEVTEHAFFQPQSPPDDMTLFDNHESASVSGLTVEFDGPYYGLAATGNLTVVDHTTYAVVTGQGILTGKPYAHTTRLLRWDDPDAAGGERVIKSDGDLLVNALNANAVLDRLKAYYTSGLTVNLPVKLAAEKAGDMITFAKPYGGLDSGLIAQAVTSVTGIRRADLKIITGYVPTGHGNYYTHRLVVTGSLTFNLTVPNGRFRVILIQGGQGGQGGTAGQDGQGGEYDPDWGLYGVLRRTVTASSNRIGYYADTQRSSSGGSKGRGGTAGKVYIAEYSSEAATVRIATTIGAGGAGGASAAFGGTPGDGAAGGHTSAVLTVDGVAHTVSSEDGVEVVGYADPFTGDVFATAGTDGYDGGAGGKTDTVGDPGLYGADGLPGGGVAAWSGGVGGAGDTLDDTQGSLELKLDVSGGGGGGAAYGSQGGAGTNGTIAGSSGSGGDGGDGANAQTPANATVYGAGGDGGHGGGGGGNGAGGQCYWYGSTQGTPYAGNGGTGGTGSAGAKGGPGVVIIYY